MSTSKKVYRVFIDESGSPDLYKGGNNFGEKYFTLAAVIIVEAGYVIYKKKLHAIRNKYVKYLSSKEIKSHSIRRSNPKGIDLKDPPEYKFYKYPDGQQKYEEFCNDIKQLIIDTKFEVINVSTNKDLASRLYPHKDILLTLLTDLWERIAIYHIVKGVRKSLIVYDPKGNLDDIQLEVSYKEFMRLGSAFVSTTVTSAIKNLYQRALPCKSDDSAGLQLVDYFAYPLKRFAETGFLTPFFRTVISPKMCNKVKDKIRGKTIYMSNKLSLNR